jgi:radical SAM protein with 4Fe4S-binding SPASM domain
MNVDLRNQSRKGEQPARPKTRPVFGSPEVAAYGAVGLGGLEPAMAPKEAEVGDGSGTYEVGRADPLPLVGGLAHHEVDDHHLWIAVEDGKLIVADSTDNELMMAFVGGASPVEVCSRVQEILGLDEEAAWRATLQFLGRVAAAGFIKGIGGYHSVRRPKPKAFARFHLTRRCQLECIHCYSESGPHLSSAGELPVERWIQLVDEFAENGGERILFTGGEALVYRGCIDIMRRAKERGLEVTLFSNGILIKRYLEDVRKYADIVQISVDGPGVESHDAIRGKGSFKKAMEAIHLLLDAGVNTRISTTIMVNNWPAIERDLPKLVAEFENTGLGFRVSYNSVAHGRGVALNHKSLDSVAVRRFVDQLMTRVKDENRETGPNAIQKISGCGYAEQLVIAPDGIVYPCHLLSGALGHVDDMPIRDITRYLERTAEAFSVDHRKGCSTCDLRNLCGGTCRVQDERTTGSRLITTCTPEEKLRKKRFLVRRYRPVSPSAPTS